MFMKEKRIWKRWACAMLAMVLMSTLSGAVYAVEEEKVEWTYENSILVTVLTEKEQSFTTADFSEINCSSVQIVDKAVTGEGVVYELVLTLKNGNETEIDRAIHVLNQSAIVKTVQRNEKFAPPKSTISLNKSTIYLKMGETVDLSIQDVNLVENSFQNIGIMFSVNPDFYDEDTFEKNSFLSYGISRFWPNTEKEKEILIERPEELEAKKSGDGKYYGWVADEDLLFDTVNNLAELPGISSVSVVQISVPGGEPPYENWTVNKTGFIELSLAGGNVAAGFNESGPRLNQIATIRGIKSGVSTVTIERGGFGAYASDACNVIVYEPDSKNNPGDMDHDGIVGAKDALQILKYSVGLISLDEADREVADLNQDNMIDAKDALLMLKIDLGVL